MEDDSALDSLFKDILCYVINNVPILSDQCKAVLEKEEEFISLPKDMKTKVIALFLCLTMTFALCACAQKEPAPTPTPDPTEDVNAYTPVSFTNHGKEITLKAMPEKVVTAGPGCSEIMCMLGLEESVIGKCMTNHTSAAPEEVSAAFDGIPELAVGYPTYYQIIESGCDFFYASSWVFSDNLKIEDLENAGITVFVSDATDFEWLWAEIRTIGSIFPSQWNWHAFWLMAAFLSVILTFMNIIPIPGLDGGHVLFLLWEVITGKKVSDKVLEKAEWVGFILLMVLMVYANANDVIRFLL